MNLTSALGALKPPTKKTVSEWSDSERVLSRESSAEPGRYKTSKTPYLREIMDAVNDFRTETIVFMKSAQVGATEAIVNIIGYFVAHDPAPILVVQPTGSMAETFSKDRIVPLFRDTPTLSDKLGTKIKSKDPTVSNNTISHKVFPGGHLTIVRFKFRSTTSL